MSKRPAERVSVSTSKGRNGEIQFSSLSKSENNLRTRRKGWNDQRGLDRCINIYQGKNSRVVNRINYDGQGRSWDLLSSQPIKHTLLGVLLYNSRSPMMN